MGQLAEGGGGEGRERGKQAGSVPLWWEEGGGKGGAAHLHTHTHASLKEANSASTAKILMTQQHRGQRSNSK